MKKHILLIALLICASATFAQKNKNTIYLKNGTIIKGEILEILPDEGVKIQTGSHVLMLQNQEIDHIEMNGKSQEKKLAEDKTYEGFFNKTALGILAGSSSSDEKAPLTFTSSIGYHFTPKLTFAAGTGLEFYKEVVLPAYGEIQYFISDKRKAPYVFAHGGWSFAIDDRKNTTMNEYNSLGGIRYGGGIGLRLWTNSGFDVIMEAGYQYQEIKTEKTEINMHYESTLIDEYNRFAIKIGFYFN